MAEQSKINFVWETDFMGKKVYGEFGCRDVIIISTSTSMTATDIVQRELGELNDDDKKRLTSEGIPSEYWEDEVKLMTARYEREDSRFDIRAVIQHAESKTVDYIIDKITTVLTKSTKPGVVIHYFGPGKRNTGDWCFKDGFITFRQLADLYKDHFRGRVLNITVDCSYSGSWVKECTNFLDEESVQPCGHSAKEKGILIRLSASCESKEVGSTLLMSATGRGNDKNSGTLTIYGDGYKLADNQHISRVDGITFTCKKLPNEPCAYSPSYTWHDKSAVSRVFLVRGKDRGLPAWHYVLLVDDPETIKKFHEAVSSGNSDVANYGQVLKSGWGQDPPNEVKEWIEKTYLGLT